MAKTKHTIANLSTLTIILSPGETLDNFLASRQNQKNIKNPKPIPKMKSLTPKSSRV